MKIHRIIAGAFVFLISIDIGHAEASKVALQGIKERFEKTNTEITAIEKSAEAAKASAISVDHYITNALNRSWEGVGNYKVSYKFYYIHDAPNDENRLLKISRVIESATRSYHEEFYYNDAQQLIFYFQKTNDTEYPKERRIYFHQGKVIRLIDDQFSRDDYTEGDKELVAGVLKSEKAIKLKFTSR